MQIINSINWQNKVKSRQMDKYGHYIIICITLMSNFNCPITGSAFTLIDVMGKVYMKCAEIKLS